MIWFIVSLFDVFFLSLRDIFHTPMARCLFVLKMPLNTNQLTNSHGHHGVDGVSPRKSVGNYYLWFLFNRPAFFPEITFG